MMLLPSPSPDVEPIHKNQPRVPDSILLSATPVIHVIGSQISCHTLYPAISQFCLRFLYDIATPVKSSASISGTGSIYSASWFQLGFSRSSGCSKAASPFACQNDLSIGASAYVYFFSCPKGHHHCSTTFTR